MPVTMKGTEKPSHMTGLRKKALRARPSSWEVMTSGTWARG